MPKPNRGLTDTIKERSIYVYLPTKEMVDSWKSEAEKAGVSISKFVIDRVKDSMKRDEGEEGHATRVELIKKLKEAEEEEKKLRGDNRMLRRLVENLESELKRYRAEPFTEESFQGVRRFDRELIDLLKGGASYNGQEILSKLGVDPSDSNMISAVNGQLEALEGYGLVEYSGRGWKWKG
jgi:hypothetical protein